MNLFQQAEQLLFVAMQNKKLPLPLRLYIAYLVGALSYRSFVEVIKTPLPKALNYDRKWKWYGEEPIHFQKWLRIFNSLSDEPYFHVFGMDRAQWDVMLDSQLYSPDGNRETAAWSVPKPAGRWESDPVRITREVVRLIASVARLFSRSNDEEDFKGCFQWKDQLEDLHQKPLTDLVLLDVEEVSAIWRRRDPNWSIMYPHLDPMPDEADEATDLA